MHFHCHLYFTPTELDFARAVSERAQESGLFESIRLHEKPVGPHPCGMIEVHFNETGQAPALAWIDENRGDFSALVHQDTGDDFKDHTEGVRWFGRELSLDFSFFELILDRPELRIHPKD